MKNSQIWLLTAVMAIALAALLYFQISYLDNMASVREAQFSECVMRSLHATVGELERQETLHFLEEDVNVIESSFYDDDDGMSSGGRINYSVTSPDGTVTDYSLNATRKSPKHEISLGSPTENLADRYRVMQETLRSQYLYQRGLLNEVILTILRESGSRPIYERADSVTVRKILSKELAANGLTVPFTFAVVSTQGKTIYATDGFEAAGGNGSYSDVLFPNNSNEWKMEVRFPTKESYVFSSVRFIIPTLVLTVILLVIFIYTIVTAFRQKKLSEMKTDFINNMTHELKTPISTISLAGQMLSDDSVRKSSSSLKHLSNVITEETKRLRFQVEKVLQMSVFDDTGNAMNLKPCDANDIISNVVNTFRIKVEKFGGSLDCNLEATDSIVKVDEMQFTNVIFNLLDNAVKYRRVDVEPHLSVTTKDIEGKQLEICVKDNGIGMRREVLKRIFDKFYRVSTGNRHDVKGFGLGLAYVKKMVNIFRGSISVESEYGKWTEFTILLPLYEVQDN